MCSFLLCLDGVGLVIFHLCCTWSLSPFPTLLILISEKHKVMNSNRPDCLVYKQDCQDLSRPRRDSRNSWRDMTTMRLHTGWAESWLTMKPGAETIPGSGPHQMLHWVWNSIREATLRLAYRIPVVSWNLASPGPTGID